VRHALRAAARRRGRGDRRRRCAAHRRHRRPPRPSPAFCGPSGLPRRCRLEPPPPVVPAARPADGGTVGGRAGGHAAVVTPPPRRPWPWLRGEAPTPRTPPSPPLWRTVAGTAIELLLPGESAASSGSPAGAIGVAFHAAAELPTHPPISNGGKSRRPPPCRRCLWRPPPTGRSPPWGRRCQLRRRRQGAGSRGWRGRHAVGRHRRQRRRPPIGWRQRRTTPAPVPAGRPCSPSPTPARCRCRPPPRRARVPGRPPTATTSGRPGPRSPRRAWGGSRGTIRRRRRYAFSLPPSTSGWRRWAAHRGRGSRRRGCRCRAPPQRSSRRPSGRGARGAARPSRWSRWGEGVEVAQPPGEGVAAGARPAVSAGVPLPVPPLSPRQAASSPSARARRSAPYAACSPGKRWTAAATRAPGHPSRVPRQATARQRGDRAAAPTDRDQRNPLLFRSQFHIEMLWSWVSSVLSWHRIRWANVNVRQSKKVEDRSIIRCPLRHSRRRRSLSLGHPPHPPRTRQPAPRRREQPPHAHTHRDMPPSRNRNGQSHTRQAKLPRQPTGHALWHCAQTYGRQAHGCNRPAHSLGAHGPGAW